MEALQVIVELAWFPLILAAFACLPARRAVLLSILGGWLFLPPRCVIPLPGFFEVNRHAAASGAALLGAIVFAAPQLLVRLRWLDAPMVIWCIAPSFSALANGDGPYEATAASYEHCLVWGAPYWLGRAFFNTRDSLTELVRAIVLAGIVYVPFCLFEVRMSPKLSGLVYGDWRISIQDIRLGGWRPRVFMSHGLELSMFMVGAWFVGAWGRPWIAGRRWFGVPQPWWTWIILGACLLCKSTGAILLGFAGAAVMALTKWTGLRVWLLMLILVSPGYAILRTCTSWSGRTAVDLVQRWNRDRAQSLQFRLDNEDLLIEKAKRQPLFGWGRFGRSRVYDLRGEDISTTDGEWIITFGVNGSVGLTALLAIMLIPSSAFLIRFSPEEWNRGLAQAAALAALLPLRMIDLIPNAMANPIFTLACGALAALCASPRSLWEGCGEDDESHGPGSPPPKRVAGLPRRLTPGHPVPFHNDSN